MRDGEHEFPGTGRFEVLSRLGHGGMGIVYEVFDRETHRRAALKTLRTKNAEMLLRFKEEFRGLQNVQHPNLVSLGELFQESGQWFFTMELVDGVNFVRYVRETGPRPAIAALDHSELFRAEHPKVVPVRRATGPRPVPASEFVVGYDDERLRSAFAQLVQALTALHRAHKVHRDIKPSNVLVTRDGRAVLLDFGFIADKLAKGHTTDGIVVGTADYMAPEQAAGKSVTPAADWYAAGVVLYRALTGQLPYTGSRMEVLIRKQQLAPPSPATVVPGVPEDLDALCMQLLAIDANRRATGVQVLAVLGVDAAEAPVTHSADPSTDQPFVGRQRELSALHDAYTQLMRGRSVTVYLAGESGVGKTALLQRFARGVVDGDSRAIVLPGRCHERESVPYKAVDGIIDVLSRVLRGEPPAVVAAVLPLNVSQLAQIFPVLRRVEAIAQAPLPPQEVRDPLELRRRVFTGLRDLLARLADRRPLVMIVEDLQWVDGDSLALLRELMMPPDEPPMLLIASARTDAGVTQKSSLASVPRFSGDDAAVDVRHIHVGGLSSAEARELAALLLRQTGANPDVGADSIAAEAGGHPLFIDELVQHTVVERGAAMVLPNLEDALWARISRLGESARKVLEIVSVAGAPLHQDIAAEAAEVDYAVFSEQTARMRVGKLTRSTGAGGSDEIEPYHGRVRDAVLEHLAPEAMKQCHRRLALALEASAADPQALSVHWHGAGDLERAGSYAEEAATHAIEALAFDRAARLYRNALEWRAAQGVQKRRLQTRLGDALAKAGRGAEAATAYLAAAHGSSAAAQLELVRMAADQLLLSGHIDDGLAALRQVLGTAGMKLADSERQAARSLLWGKARLRLRGLRFRERDATQVALEELTLIDILWTVSMGLSNVDVLRGAEYQTRHMIEALDAGEPYRICRALAAEVGYSTGSGDKWRRRTDKLLRTAAQIADRLDNDHARGLVSLAEGIGSALEGEWSKSLAAAEAAELILRDFCTNVWWERNSAQLVAHRALAMLGRIGDLAGRVPRRLREAEERGDLYAATNLVIGLPNLVRLAADDPVGARAQAQEAMRRWSRRGFHVQHYAELVAQAHIDLYAGDARAAHRRVLDKWPALEQSQLRRVQLNRVLSSHLRARTALGCGEVREAVKYARQILREPGGWSVPLADLVLAGSAARGGDDGEAVKRLEAAAAGFDRVEMALYAAAARRRLGERIGGDEGKALIAQADTWMATEGIKQPRPMTELLAPGFDI